MKSRTLFRALLVSLLLLSLPSETVTARTNEGQQSYVTAAMAKKIEYFCRDNDFQMAMFARANNINSGRELDIIISTLDRHLEYAENYLMEVYYRYGIERGYHALKSMGFTIPEIDKVEAAWNKEVDRKRAIAERKKKEEEQEAERLRAIEEQKNKEQEQILLKQIEANDTFSISSLSTKPYIKFDIASIATDPVFNAKDEYVNCDYHFIVCKDGKLSLKNPSDTLDYSAVQKHIYQYIVDYDRCLAGSISISGKEIPVNSCFDINIYEERLKLNEPLTITIKKSKKTGRWEFTEDISAKLKDWAKDDSRLHSGDLNKIRLDMEDAINNCSMLNKLKGKKTLEIETYRRTLKSNLPIIMYLSYYFDMKQVK